MFTKSCEYGIRALIVIAEETKGGGRIGIKEIVKRSKTPESFTAKILQLLAKRKIIDSQKGPSGGFYVTKDLDSIKLYDIVDAIDGNAIFTGCGLGMAECDASRPCPLHHEFDEVRGRLIQMCRTNSLQDLVEGYHESVFSR